MPVTGYIPALRFYDPPSAADIEKDLLATNGKVLNYRWFEESFTLGISVGILGRYYVLFFQVDNYLS